MPGMSDLVARPRERARSRWMRLQRQMVDSDRHPRAPLIAAWQGEPRPEGERHAA